MRRIRTILLLFTLLTSISVTAQRERNYIYVLDCTKSMIGFGNSPVIWEPTLNYLKNDLAKQSPNTTVHIIPFQGKTLPCYSCYASEIDWEKIRNELDKIVNGLPSNTNICEAWDATDRYIDPHKDNYIILLTDGKDNVTGMDAVAKKLSDWCGKHPNTYAFYVRLTEAAIDQKVAEVINICDNEFVVDAKEGRIPVFGGFDKGLIIYANTLNLKKTHQIAFSSAGKYAANATCTDDYFDVKVVGNKIEGGIVSVQIMAKQPLAQINAALPEVYDFTFDIQSNEVSIINPTVRVLMTNKSERTLELLSEEAELGKATWYDRFLFWGASTPDTLKIDLEAVFNNEAKKDGSVVDMHVSDPNGGKDFQLFYNGQPIDNGSFELFGRQEGKSELSVVFNPDAKEGKRYFEIKATKKRQLDKINDKPVETYLLSLRSEYSVNWNPLKTFLMWLGILLLAALLLWFLIVKHLIFPTIGVKTIQINEPYYSRINIKGKRRVVFTNKTMRQSLLSRIFTGEILYKKHDIWTSPLALEAGGKKKTLRVMRTKDYAFDPYTSMLKAPGDYVVENTNDKTKIKLTIN